MNEYEIKNNKIFPVIIIVVGILLLGISIVTGFSTNAITGILLLTIGIIRVSKPAAIITKDEIEIKNLFGMTLKTYPYTTNGISFKDNNLYLNDKIDNLFL